MARILRNAESYQSFLWKPQKFRLGFLDVDIGHIDLAVSPEKKWNYLILEIFCISEKFQLDIGPPLCVRTEFMNLCFVFVFSLIVSVFTILDQNALKTIENVSATISTEF